MSPNGSDVPNLLPLETVVSLKRGRKLDCVDWSALKLTFLISVAAATHPERYQFVDTDAQKIQRAARLDIVAT